MNKSFIVLCALVLAATWVNAQTSSGSMMLGGGLNFSSSSSQTGSNNDQNSVAFSPGFGYFIGDNFAVGTTLYLASSRSGTGANKTVQSAFGLGPFARYYLFTSNDRFAFFGQAQLVFSTSKYDPPAGNVTKGNEISFALSPGAAFFFNEHWALEFSIRGFALTSGDPNTNNDDDKYTEVELGLNSFSPSLGFRYHF
jgi:outer membrane protein